MGIVGTGRLVDGVGIRSAMIGSLRDETWVDVAIIVVPIVPAVTSSFSVRFSLLIHNSLADRGALVTMLRVVFWCNVNRILV
jgi:hypothetical protein